MTERDRFIRALKRQPLTGHVPTFELVFFLTMEKLGKVHPAHRCYAQWNQMSVQEREAHLHDMAFCFTEIAKIYHHSAIFVHPNPGDFDSTVRLLQIIRESTGEEYFLLMHGDPTFPIPTGEDMTDFSVRLYEDREGLRREQDAAVGKQLEFAEKLKSTDGGRLLDGFGMCSDYCFRYYAIKHTDGNILPILDAMVQCGPDAIHSLDPQGGVDLKYVKKKYGDKVALIGNVNCGLLQTGTLEEMCADVRRALRDGMPGGGFIFSTSNCVYTGLALERYETMNRIWWEEGIYPV